MEEIKYFLLIFNLTFYENIIVVNLKIKICYMRSSRINFKYANALISSKINNNLFLLINR